VVVVVVVASRTGRGHAYGTVARRHAVHVAVRPDAHGRGDRQTGARRHLDRPLHLFHVLEVLTFTRNKRPGSSVMIHAIETNRFQLDLTNLLSVSFHTTLFGTFATTRAATLINLQS